MSTLTERREDAKREAYEPDYETCPDCGHASAVVTRYLCATRLEPAEVDLRCTCLDRRKYRGGDLQPCPSHDESDPPCEECCSCEWET